ncbi:hypothetical protein EBBID32_45730 [Sphingobium indicum BiD32]|uniref:Uncharacterized protein n=1 Tax=Sphingobium indicum BiD32 TaxID=1301087 RepID=N1MTY5_9SPHN|nr:hypothetical protein [Sphingobium indicum]CCW20199.1 hypothetical protein EBBID32_45730 [Sphingobium indicum BiD32]
MDDPLLNIVPAQARYAARDGRLCAARIAVSWLISSIAAVLFIAFTVGCDGELRSDVTAGPENHWTKKSRPEGRLYKF